MRKIFLLIIIIGSIFLVSCDEKTTSSSSMPTSSVGFIEELVFSEQTFLYDGEVKSIFITGDLPESISVEYENNNKSEVGNYTVTASFNDSLGIYNNIPDMTAILTIKPESLSGIEFNGESFVYDGISKSIFIKGDLPVGVNVSYINNEHVDFGSYVVTAKFTDTTGNYTNLIDLSANLEISKATHDVSSLLFNDYTLVYDGDEESLVIDGDLPEGVSVEYTSNTLTNVGAVEVVASFIDINPNYEQIPNLTAILTVLPGNFEGVEFNDDSFLYDGKKKSIELIGDLPEGISVKYINNEQVLVGSYTVTAIFTDLLGNYSELLDLTATLDITKGSHDLSGILFADKTVVYDGEKHIIEIEGELPSGVTVAYSSNNITNVGELEVVASFNDINNNYEEIPNMTATLTILPKPLSGIEFNDAIFIYDTETKSLEIEGELPKSISVSYSNNSNTEVGDYLVTATFSDSSNNYSNLDSIEATMTIKYSVIYTLAFDSLLGSIVESEQVGYLAKGTRPTDPIKSGYDFLNWTLNGEVWNFETDLITSDTILIAAWTPKIVTLSLDDEGNIFELEKTFGEPLALPTGESTIGKFIGWTNGEVIFNNEDSLFTTNTSLTAVYTDFIITFTSETETTILDMSFDGHTKVSNLPELTKEGAIFVNWQIFGTDTVFNNDEYLTTDINLYAKWIYTKDSYQYENVDHLSSEEDFTNIEIVKYTGDSEIVNIPISINGRKVVRIKEEAFFENGTIKEVYIPSDIYVDYEAFMNCEHLNKTVYTKDTLGYILNYDDSVSVISIYIDVLTDTIPSNILINNISYSVSSIGDYAFLNCSNLNSIDIPNSITSIGNNAFEQCINLVNIDIPDTVTSIGSFAFSGCFSLITIDIPIGVTRIESSTFLQCQNLRYLTLSDNIISIGISAFNGCTSLVSIEIPTNVTVIETRSFSGCTNLINVGIPTNVTTIKESAFYECTNLRTLIIPISVISIVNDAFYLCNNLTIITEHEEKPIRWEMSTDGTLQKILYGVGTDSYVIVDDLLFVVTESGASLESSSINAVDVIIPSTVVINEIEYDVTRIGDYAFSNLSHLLSVIIPETVTTIGDYAFKDCINLTVAEVPDTVVNEADNAFSGCTSLNQ